MRKQRERMSVKIIMAALWSVILGLWVLKVYGLEFKDGAASGGDEDSICSKHTSNQQVANSQPTLTKPSLTTAAKHTMMQHKFFPSLCDAAHNFPHREKQEPASQPSSNPRLSRLAHRPCLTQSYETFPSLRSTSHHSTPTHPS